MGAARNRGARDDHRARRRPCHRPAAGPDADPGTDTRLRAEDRRDLHRASHCAALRGPGDERPYEQRRRPYRSILADRAAVLTFHLNDLTGLVLVYFLVLVRTGAMLMLLPPINQAGVPSRVRLMLGLAITFALTPGLAHNFPAQMPSAPMALGVLVAEEATAGLLNGAMATIIMSALSVAGMIISTQTGLSYAQILNPTMGDSEPVFANFLTLLGGTMIFATNPHHRAVGAIQGS